MNSKERKEARYQRRREKRLAKRKKFIDSLGTYEDIFSYKNLYDSFHYCKQGVLWKPSIQSYQANLPTNIYELYSELRKCAYRTKGFKEFRICERGKMRNIKSVHISERCVQRCFCDHYLVPLLSKNLIYDNGASLKGKGTDFALNRIKIHLRNHYKKYNNSGYILLYDFSNYFGNINHDILYSMVDELIADEKLRKLYHQFVDAFTDTGLGLGSQISQVSAVAFPNIIDHTFKDKMGVNGYGRYMDDGYIISNDLQFLKECEKVLYDLCNKLDIQINEKKIRIIKLTHTFTFLKKRITLTSTGKVIVRLSRKTLYSTRRRLKKLKILMGEGKISYENVKLAYLSWRGSVVKYKNYFAICKIDDLYYDLFGRKEYYG